MALLSVRVEREKSSTGEDGHGVGALKEREKSSRTVLVPAGPDDRGRVDDARALGGRNEKCFARMRRRRDVGAADDGGIPRAVLDPRPRDPDAAGRNELLLDRRPDANLLQILFRVDTRGNG